MDLFYHNLARIQKIFIKPALSRFFKGILQGGVFSAEKTKVRGNAVHFPGP
jgi:hypothetical protein